MNGAGKPVKPKGAISSKSAGELYDGYMMAESVSGLVRIDLYDFELGVEAPLNSRFCKIMDLDVARSFAILLIGAIAEAEMDDAMAKRVKQIKVKK